MRMAAAQSADVRIPGPWGSVDALGDELDGLVVLKIIAVSSNGERLGLESGDHSSGIAARDCPILRYSRAARSRSSCVPFTGNGILRIQ
jgi:hypothetical protein